MINLHQKNCIPCRGGVLPFDISEIHKYLKKIDGWNVKKNKDEIYYLEKNFWGSWFRVIDLRCIGSTYPKAQ